MKIKTTLLTVMALTAIAENAHADYYKLYAPKVEEGELSAEADLNYSADHRPANDNYLSQVYSLEYGVTDYWMTELGAEIEKETPHSTRLTNIKWENVITPFKPGENWLDAGLYVELEKATQNGAPDNAEFKLLLEKDFGQWVNIVNAGVSRQFGSGRANGWDTGLALKSSYRVNEMFEPGLEYYADFGNNRDHLAFDDQDHRFGPVVAGKFGSVKYDTGVLFGVSGAAQDTTFKLNFEYEF